MEKTPKFTFDAESKELLDKAAKALDDEQLDLFKSIMNEKCGAVSTRPFPEGTFYKIPPPPQPIRVE
jgi:hypothetical protein